jgi:hypothetical protein
VSLSTVSFEQSIVFCSIFHLAAILSAQTGSDYDLGMKVRISRIGYDVNLFHQALMANEGLLYLGNYFYIKYERHTFGRRFPGKSSDWSAWTL